MHTCPRDKGCPDWVTSMMDEQMRRKYQGWFCMYVCVCVCVCVCDVFQRLASFIFVVSAPLPFIRSLVLGWVIFYF